MIIVVVELELFPNGFFRHYAIFYQFGVSSLLFMINYIGIEYEMGVAILTNPYYLQVIWMHNEY